MDDKQLMLIDKGRRALAEAKTVGDFKDIRDKAAALQYYLQKQKGSEEAARYAAELKLQAERRAGALLRTTVRQGGDAEYRRLHAETFDLPDGIDKTHSHRWQTVANVSDEEFEEYLAEMREKEETPTTAAVYRLAKQNENEQKRVHLRSTTVETCEVKDLESLILRGKKFGTILADPPWQYGNQATRAATDNHYETMTVDDIAALPIRDLAADNAHLHLWTTNGFLFESKDILESWGFTYKSVMLWVKPTMGIGNYWRVSHEFLLLGVRGECPFLDRGQMSWIQADRQEHSAKPGVFRQAIELVSPGPRLELFGRRLSEGWAVWGDEIERTMFEVNIETFGKEQHETT